MRTQREKRGRERERRKETTAIGGTGERERWKKQRERTEYVYSGADGWRVCKKRKSRLQMHIAFDRNRMYMV